MTVNTEYIYLFGMGMISALLSVVLYISGKKKFIREMSPVVKNIIAGVLFGCVAIVNTEFGISYEGFVLNARDVAPICAGLLFSPLSGFVAGLIGGVERYLAVLWGVGAYTRIACSLGTLFAGLIAGLIKKIMFYDTRPKWFYGLLIGMNIEVLHMALVFITHPNEVRKDYEIVTVSGIPMIIVTGLCVGIACASLFIMDQKHRGRTKYSTISSKFQSITALCIIVAVILSIGTTSFMQYSLMKEDSKETLNNNVEDVIQEISDISDRCLMQTTRYVVKNLPASSKYSNALLKRLSATYNVYELSLVDKYGTVKYSTKDYLIGINMYDTKDTYSLMNKLRANPKGIIYDFAESEDEENVTKYCAIQLDNEWIIGASYDSQCIRELTKNDISSVAANRRIGKNGWMMVLDTSFMIVSSGEGKTGIHASQAGLRSERQENDEKNLLESCVYGVDYYAAYGYRDGYYIIGLIPKEEAEFTRNLFIIIVTYLEMMLFGVMFLNIVFTVEKAVVHNVHKFNRSFRKITAGELDVQIEDIKIQEFSELAEDANATVVKLKTLIDEAKEKIEEELRFAASIQEGALERQFPPFPDEKRFDIHCTMDPAKEVGGDFYDFFFVNDKTFAFLVADVSGKGVPAAMFMMTAKTLIKSMGKSGLPVNQILYLANEELCAHNEAGMFVTCWMGIMDLDTGVVRYTCAGHNPPLIKRKDGSFEYLRGKINLVLAAMDGVPYDAGEITLEKGDELFLYTDGVTEATNSQNELYGEERLQSILNEKKPEEAFDVCLAVKADIDKFVGEADQFDDITMLSFKYGKGSNIALLEIEKEAEEQKEKAEHIPIKHQLVFFEEVDEETINTGEEKMSEVLFEEFNIGEDGKNEEEVEEFVFVTKSDSAAKEQQEDGDFEEFVFGAKTEKKDSVSVDNELTIEAVTENVPVITEFVDAKLESIDCPMKAQMQIDIAIDEIVSNIAYYAYNPDVGPATIKVDVKDNPMRVDITFIDNGIPYDPLKKEDPNTHLPLEERGVGGLGIFMVKQTMDDITYEYKEGQNILTIKKNIE